MFLVITLISLTRIFEQLFCPKLFRRSLHRIEKYLIKASPSLNNHLFAISLISPQVRETEKRVIAQCVFVSEKIHLFTFWFDLTFLKDAIFKSGSLLQRGALSFNAPTVDLIFPFCTKNTLYFYNWYLSVWVEFSKCPIVCVYVATNNTLCVRTI